MLIELPDETIIKLHNIADPFDTIITTINSLFDSMRKSKHIIYASDTVLKAIEEHNLISPTNKKFVAWIRQKRIYVYEGYDAVTYKIIVDYSIEEIKVVDKIFYVPIFCLEDIRETKLLAENETDGEMFLNIFTHVFKHKNMSKNLTVNFENDSFHGSNAPSSIRQHAKKNAILMCIVDSDREYVGARRGSTWVGANNEFKKLKKNHIIELYDLKVREKENLVPPNLYQLVLNNENPLLKVLEEEMNNNKSVFFFNIKDGVNLKTIEKYSDDVRWQKYYKGIIDKCRALGIYMELEGKDSSHLCIKGIGSNMCERVNDLILSIDGESYEENFLHSGLSMDKKPDIDRARSDIFSFVTGELELEWESIAKLLFSWGCCLSSEYLQTARYFS